MSETRQRVRIKHDTRKMIWNWNWEAQHFDGHWITDYRGTAVTSTKAVKQGLKSLGVGDIFNLEIHR